jgi:cell division septal protein FtsQ
MSEKKSWDVRPSKPARRPIEAVRPRNTVRPVETRRPASPSRATHTVERVPELTLVARTGRKDGKGGRVNLRSRRRRARKLLTIAAIFLTAVLIGSILYMLWLPGFRIQEVRASGPDTDLVASTAKQSLAGSYLHLIPHDSIFFFPEGAVRDAILAADPVVQAVSISRSSLTSISINSIPRSMAFWWCGQTRAQGTSVSGCYQSDTEGFLFAPVQTTLQNSGIQTAPSSVGTTTPQTSTTTNTAFAKAVVNTTLPDLGQLLIYSPLSATSTGTVIGSTVEQAADVPNILRFARSLQSLHADIQTVQIRGDEVDLFVKSGTRITYVIGDEDAAAARAQAAFPQINLDDGSIDYVDLRFDGKVYFKRMNQASQ